MNKKQQSLFLPFLLIVTLFLIIVTMYTSRKTISFLTNNQSYFNNGKLVLEQMCEVTKDIEKLRQYRNNSEVNPARQVVDELLEIVTKNSANVCMMDNYDSHMAVILVSSPRASFMERQLIRKTWGSIDKYRGWRIHTVFLMGQSEYCLVPGNNGTRENEIINEELGLMKEYEKYGDLVVGAFADTFKNETYKHLMGYKYVLESCPDADLIIKTNDNMFVDITKIIDTRETELRTHSYDKNPQSLSDIFCHLYQDGPTRCRDCANKKWFSTREEWPEDKYPLYCIGNDYAISREWLEKIYSVRTEGGFFWVDDVFIMGKLREIAETNYGKVTNRRSIRENVTDKRGLSYVKDNCKKDDEDLFGMFVFLQSSTEEFSREVECLWRRVLRKMNILILKND